MIAQLVKVGIAIYWIAGSLVIPGGVYHFASLPSKIQRIIPLAFITYDKL